MSLFAAETALRLRVEGRPAAPDEAARELAFIADNACAISGVRPDVRGTLPNQPCVLVANHVSYLDPLLIASLVPSSPIAKREVGSWPVVGEIAKRTGVMFVDRDCPLSGARVLRACLRSIERGVSVLVFPEGSTTRGGRPLPFKRGSFGVAKLAGVPIVPVAISYERTDVAWVGDDTLLPHVARMLSRPITHVSLRFLAPIAADSGEAQELAERAHEQMTQALLEMRMHHARSQRTYTPRALAVA
jgi:1-acyl-sn-glycerol-3-phosphate acyltransferase